MAITITANNANGDGTGIDVTAYLATFVSPTYSPVGFGYFSSDPSDFSGNQYAVTEQPNLIPDTTKQAIVFESGGGANSIDYDFNTHIVGGDLDAISFGYGVTYTSGTDSFPLSQLDLRISGLGFVNQTGAGSTVRGAPQRREDRLITNLSNLLAANAIIFVGSTGADVFTGYAHNDTSHRRWRQRHAGRRRRQRHRGLQRQQGRLHRHQQRRGTWTITDNRGGTPDGSRHADRFRVRAVRRPDGRARRQRAPVASNDSVLDGEEHRRRRSTFWATTRTRTARSTRPRVTVVDGPDHGTVSVNATTGAITYTPTAGLRRHGQLHLHGEGQ